MAELALAAVWFALIGHMFYSAGIWHWFVRIVLAAVLWFAWVMATNADERANFVKIFKKTEDEK